MLTFHGEDTLKGSHTESHIEIPEGQGGRTARRGEKERAGRIGMTLHRTARRVTQPYGYNGTRTTSY